MTTLDVLWKRLDGLNVHSDKELFRWIAEFGAYAYSTSEAITSGFRTAASLKLGRELKVRPDWDIAQQPSDKSLSARRRWLLTWLMNALNPRDGEDLAAIYRICEDHAKRWLPLTRRTI